MNRRARQSGQLEFVPTPASQSVAARARELWESCGEPVVSDDAIWREAERELLTEQQPRQGRTAAPHSRSSR